MVNLFLMISDQIGMESRLETARKSLILRERIHWGGEGRIGDVTYVLHAKPMPGIKTILFPVNE